MSLRNKVLAAVDQAFLAVDDLKKTATLSSTTVSSFNFTTGVTVGSPSTTTIEVVKLTKTNPITKANTTSVIMKSVIDLSVYDTLTIDGIDYNIGSYTDNDFVIEAEIQKEDN